MVYRKGELQLSTVDRKWPHHVVLPAAACSRQNYHPVQDFCREQSLSLWGRGHTPRRNPDWFYVFCFADPTHAAIFKERFGGEAIEPTLRARRAFCDKPKEGTQWQA